MRRYTENKRDKRYKKQSKAPGDLEVTLVFC